MAQFIYALNNFMEPVYNGLNRNLTFSENILSFQKTFQFTTRSDYTAASSWDEVSLSIPDYFKVRVTGAWIVQGGPTDTSLIKNIQGLYFSWMEDNRSIKINWIGGLDDDTQYSFTIVVI